MKSALPARVEPALRRLDALGPRRGVAVGAGATAMLCGAAAAASPYAMLGAGAVCVGAALWVAARAKAVVVLVELPVRPPYDPAETPYRSKMVQAPAGAFWMGSPEGVGDDDERPRHRVELSAFWIGATEVTQAQYEAVMGENPSYFQGENGGVAKHPVENVNWFQAVAYCNRLSELEGLKPAYIVKDRRGLPWPPKMSNLAGNLAERVRNGQDPEKLPVVERDTSADGYRLPTEAEWEYAARAGTETPYWSGDSEDDLALVGWYVTNSDGTTHPVGEKPANTWGLHDVHGNVWEWTTDWFPADGYSNAIVTDPRALPTARHRVCRGGSYWDDPDRARAAFRVRSSPDLANRVLGFRVVRPAL